jgi:phasin family protein
MAAKATANNGRSQGLGSAFPGAAFPGAAMPNLEPLMQASNKMLENWVALSTQILEFNKARIDDSIQASRAIASSSSINEAMDLQANFTRNLVQEYLSEATKIADLSTRTIMDGISAMQKSATAEPPQNQAAE